MNFKKTMTVYSALLAACGAQAGVSRAPEVRPGEFVVKTAPLTSFAVQSSMLSAGFSFKSDVNANEGIFSVRTNERLSISAALKTLRAIPGVQIAEPNFVYRASPIHRAAIQETIDQMLTRSNPNDAQFGKLWGMNNVGQTDGTGQVGVNGADIKALQAWNISTGSRKVLVAVVDTGIDYTHPDLKDNVWTMPGTTDVHGFNAITGKEDPMDDNSHGTHCSGTIGALGNNGIGVAGVNWNVSIMGVKFLSAEGSGDLEGAVKAIDWAVDHGAQVLSNSWGGGGYSDILEASIKRAGDKGILFIAAAGNDSSNNDAVPAYPASYKLDNVISVAASNNRDELADFSNYGPTTSHLMAPGDGILSTTPGNNYATYSGTSMATPHVSGAAALLLSKEPGLTPIQVRDRLMATSDKIKAVRRKLISGGRLNIYNMLTNTVPPGFPEIPADSWSAPVAKVIESPHPYPMQMNQRWVIDQPGATFIRVHFTKFETESRFDFVRLINGAGEAEDELTGQLADNTWSAEIPGSHLEIVMTSDDSVDGYGFAIDSYSWTSYEQR